jgi:serine/threonine-protein kinase
MLLTAAKSKTQARRKDTYDVSVSAPVARDPLEGALLDRRYRVETRIATGGMSTVYRGLDVRLDRPVALKVMDPRYSRDEQFLIRFQLEARAAARLSEPGLVAVYDQGLDGDYPFLVMELVEGGTLRELLAERGPMPPHAVVAVLRPVLRGLAAAHRARLVHRDVKPENVLISDDGDIKLADFGLVRAVAQAGITSASVIMGTAAYLSPEQVGAGIVSPRSDVYSVGILTYELLTGTTPFAGDTQLAVAYTRMDHDVPAPSSMIDGVPPQFDALVRRATARDPACRYADASQMGAAVDAITAELGLPPYWVPAPRNSAQHPSAMPHPGRVDDQPPRDLPGPAGAPVPHATLAMTRGPHDGRPVPAPGQHEDLPAASLFAGIEMDEFAWLRRRSRRLTLFWLAVVLIVTILVAAAAWTVGTNLNGLIG